MEEKIVTINKSAIFKKLKKTGKSVTDKAKKKGGHLVNGVKIRATSVKSKATGVKDNLQNKIVDKSLAINEKQAKIIEKFRATGG
tara:strand:- start:21 stop:275 length:255 start_codon:yes stop_codon:yes gene_type:complete